MLTDAEMQDIANAHAAEHYGVEWDAEALFTHLDPRGAYYHAHKIGTPEWVNQSIDDRSREFITGDGGFFVHRGTGEVWHFDSTQVFGLETWLQRYQAGWRPGWYMVRIAVSSTWGVARKLHGLEALVATNVSEETWVPGSRLAIRRQLGRTAQFLIQGARFPDLASSGLEFSAEYLGERTRRKWSPRYSHHLLWWLDDQFLLSDRFWRYLMSHSYSIRLTVGSRDDKDGTNDRPRQS